MSKGAYIGNLAWLAAICLLSFFSPLPSVREIAVIIVAAGFIVITLAYLIRRKRN
ncbi:MAG: hypothetical protein ACE3JK_02040 [Sporolactobacillus sp.]